MTLHQSLFIRKALLLLLFLFVCLGTLSQVYSASRAGVHVGSLRFSPKVKSLAELRWKNLTRQGWDMSCGAAALSTLLIYHHGRQFSEMAVTLTILKNSDPALVRERGGFSLYDLKRFVRAVGLEGVGYGEMTLDDLEHFGLPAILPVRIGDFDHFVIFKKRVGEHVFLGDPSFGNISFPVERFERMWESQIAFFVINSLEKEVMARFETAESRSPLSPELMEMALPDVGYATRILSRLPILPLTRRRISVAP